MLSFRPTFHRILHLVLLLIFLAGCSPVQADPLAAPTAGPPTAVPATAIPPTATVQQLTSTPAPEPTSPADVQPDASLPGNGPTPTTVVLSQGSLPGWKVYANPDYGFSFQYPPDWTIKTAYGTMVGHGVILTPVEAPHTQVVVNFKRTSEDTFIGRTGMGGGELFKIGRVLFLGKETQRTVLVMDGKPLTVLYSSLRRGSLDFYIAVDSLSSGPDASGIPSGVEARADEIVASLTMDGPVPALLTSMDAGMLVQVKQSEILTVVLNGNLTTGYSWLFDPADEALFKPVGEPEAVPANDLLGATARISLKFQVVQPGKSTLNLAYLRSWEPDAKPEATFEAFVEVR